MDNKITFSNAIGLPEDLVPALMHSHVCEYASIKKDGTPITSPLIPFPGADGRTIDVNTGLAYCWKAERARNNPKVCLLYSDPKCLVGERPPVILVYGQATVYDADLQENTDRYALAIRERSTLFGRLPMFTLQWMVGYIARIWIAITPLKVLWWPECNMDRTPLKWTAPESVKAPPSDPKPRPLQTPHIPLTNTPTEWRIDMQHAIAQLGEPILTVVDDEGYPVPFRVQGCELNAGRVILDLNPATPVEPKGRACLMFHSLQVKNGEMIANENLSFTGAVSGDGERTIFKVERQLPSVSFQLGIKDMLSLGNMMLNMKKRLEVEAKRRGQPVPIVRLLEH